MSGDCGRNGTTRLELPALGGFYDFLCHLAGILREQLVPKLILGVPMRVALTLALMLCSGLAEAADRSRPVPRPLLVTKAAPATAAVFGPYTCSAPQLRAGCWNFVSTSSHVSLFEGTATCVCSRIGH